MPTSFAPPEVAPIPPGFFALVTRSYQAAPGARNALRHDLHATGVI